MPTHPWERYGSTSIMGMYLLILSTSIFKAYAGYMGNEGNGKVINSHECKGIG